MARVLSGGLILLALEGLFGRVMVNEILIRKSDRVLTALASDGSVLAEFPIALGRQPVGHKLREGDERTPEGEYYVCFKNSQSRFHLSLGVSYPGPSDAERGFAEGVIGEEELRRIREAHERRSIPPWKTALGGEIFIHGGLDGHPATAGCVALRNEHIESLFPLVPVGTPIRIEP